MRPDGSPDTAVAESGLLVLRPGDGIGHRVHSLLVDRRGRLLVYGHATIGGLRKIALFRLLP